MQQDGDSWDIVLMRVTEEYRILNSYVLFKQSIEERPPVCLAINFTAETTQKILTKFDKAACIKISKTFVLYMNLPSNCYVCSPRCT